MARRPTFRDAIRLALEDEFASDPSTLLLGEDVAHAGGVFQATRGLLERFGSQRVIDTPISELALAGTAFGLSVAGYRPVIEIMFGDFAALAADSLINQAAKYKFWSGGESCIPLTVRCTTGPGMRFGAIHSQNPASLFLSIPGLLVAAPATAEDAYSLLRTAIRTNDPVIFLEHKALYGLRAEKSEFLVDDSPLGTAAVRRRGGDITIASVMRGVHIALEAASALEADGISCDVIDLRSLKPLDVQCVIDSTSRTKRLLVLDDSPVLYGWTSELVATVVAKVALSWVGRLGAADSPLPFSPVLEDAVLPSAADVSDVVRKAVSG
jgi:pyruvate/2-oxoglutarate/acetoin dehydrogenase E1 component